MSIPESHSKHSESKRNWKYFTNVLKEMEKIFYKGELRLKLIPNFSLFFFDSNIFRWSSTEEKSSLYKPWKSLGCLGDKRESALRKVRLISLKVNRNLFPTNGLKSQKVNSAGNNPPKSKVTRKAPKVDLSSCVTRKAPKENLHY